MAMFPALMNNSIFGDFFDDPFFNNWHDSRRQGDGKGLAMNSILMNTDVRETDDQYRIDVDMPGFDKKDIALRLENGYLVVSAQKSGDQGDKDDKGRWIRRERYTGSCSRSFYVGDQVRQEDIHAKYTNGTLAISLPKASVKPVENKKTIAIED
ncbi:Hsp20 family heat shock chaperone [Bifidobacterium coryneforme]|uniref:Hsp20 family heat shock chaperone n=1 Tax=Bifidobacterium coryneforme TaxID=1687 RepID=A0ABD4AF38_9BIFI|nr:Hsp20/alpha crystallin family protein [Bifidobacterium coryneforme]KJY53744.1 Hsp20 family heat shock chaperone [Bifidobacterium coryneforme]